MNPLCAPPSAPGLAARLLADTDCQAFGLVERGYAALAQPGGAVSALLTGLMVLAVAWFGYRLLLGRGSLADAVALAVKLGVVLLIATSWASWQTLAYDTLARAPTRVAADLVTAIGAPEPLSGLQRTLDRLEAAGVGWRTRAGIASPLAGGPPAAAATLNLSGFVLTLATVGLLVVARVVLALLLAIAPLMAGFLLFRSTRGLAEGWLRAMIAAALIPLAVLTLFAVELAILGPLIARMTAEQARDVFVVGQVTPIGLVVIVFALATLAAVRAGATIARGLRLPRGTDAPVPAAVPAAPPPAPAPEYAEGAQRVVRALETLSRCDGGAPAFAGPGRRVAPALAAAASRERRAAAASAAPTQPWTAAAPRPALARAPRRTRAAARRDA